MSRAATAGRPPAGSRFAASTRDSNSPGESTRHSVPGGRSLVTSFAGTRTRMTSEPATAVLGDSVKATTSARNIGRARLRPSRIPLPQIEARFEPDLVAGSDRGSPSRIGGRPGSSPGPQRTRRRRFAGPVKTSIHTGLDSMNAVPMPRSMQPI